MAPLAQKRLYLAWDYLQLTIQVNFFNERNQRLLGDNFEDIRKIRVQIIFVFNGLIMRAVC